MPEVLLQNNIKKLLQNISKLQLPKILSKDPALPEGIKVGDIIKIERKESDGATKLYYRVVV